MQCSSAHCFSGTPAFPPACIARDSGYRRFCWSDHCGTKTGDRMDIRSIQKPLKEQYRHEPGSSRITLIANGSETATPLACSVDIGRAIYQAEVHKGVGGSGTAACSGDLLIGALAACAQLTCQL